MEYKKGKCRPNGFYLLLLIILLFFYAGIKRHGKPDRPDEPLLKFDMDKMSAYQRVTLNIPISINHESAYSLTAVPGIGSSLAERIVKEREINGGYTNLEQLKNLPGVGDKTFKKIIPFLKL